MTPQENVDDVVIHSGSVAGFSTLPELAEMVRQLWPSVVTSDLRQWKVLLTGICRVAKDRAWDCQMRCRALR
jgi:hypothetical protein